MWRDRAPRARPSTASSFPTPTTVTSSRRPSGLARKHPDDFVIDVIGLSPGALATVVAEQAAALKSPPRSTAELLDTLRDQGLVRSVAKLRELFTPSDL